ncbi:MAG: hypothetical protein KDK78_10105 [Chlamydiia bacterium]|nr:hypothetical protein [Chlamydiia bacterium]
MWLRVAQWFGCSPSNVSEDELPLLYLEGSLQDPLSRLHGMLYELEEKRQKAEALMYEGTAESCRLQLSLETDLALQTHGILAYALASDLPTLRPVLRTHEAARFSRIYIGLLRQMLRFEKQADFLAFVEEMSVRYATLHISVAYVVDLTELVLEAKDPPQCLHDLCGLANHQQFLLASEASRLLEAVHVRSPTLKEPCSHNESLSGWSCELFSTLERQAHIEAEAFVAEAELQQGSSAWSIEDPQNCDVTTINGLE